MTAYADMHEVINRKTGGNSGAPEFYMINKEWRIGGAAAGVTLTGRWYSTWLLEGSPSHGSTPGAAAACDNTTVGGWLQTAPGGGRQKWLDSLSAYLNCTTATSGVVVVYDRLLHSGNLDGTLTTAQTVGGSITRNTGGAGNQIFVEIYTQVGATNTTATISYTNENGTSGRTATVSFGGTGLREAARIIPVTLQSGDAGVRSVQSVTLTATTGTAGAFGITISRPIDVIGIHITGMSATKTYLDGNMPDVSGACICAALLPPSPVTPISLGFLASMAER
ncbi:MAG: hypothetical protein QOI20_3271 [Acidimicrobiaceae bacterium]|jgi:hypothetical protein|nr:hypothetical protein [Acidimicrobiaceae bacterium]